MRKSDLTHTDTILILNRGHVAVVSLMASQDRLQTGPSNAHLMTHTQTHMHTLKYPNIYSLGVESDRTLRCLSKPADVPPPSSSTPAVCVNISDTGEMGACTPAVTLIFGRAPFHLVPTGSQLNAWPRWGLGWWSWSVTVVCFRPQELHPCREMVPKTALKTDWPLTQASRSCLVQIWPNRSDCTSAVLCFSDNQSHTKRSRSGETGAGTLLWKTIEHIPPAYQWTITKSFMTLPMRVRPEACLYRKKSVKLYPG